jgi:capsular exopolysaccharide synthesis family protein
MDPGQLIPANPLAAESPDGVYSIELGRRQDYPDYPQVLGAESPFQQYWRILLKRRATVLCCLVVIFSLVTIATFKMTPTYQATGRIAINKLDPGVLSLKDIGQGEDYDDPSELDTQVKILQSDSLALQVIRQLNLDKDPAFAGGEAADTTKLENLTSDSLRVDSNRTTALLGSFRGGLRVTRVPSTRIIQIDYLSADPKLAAGVVNTLEKTFIEQNFKTKFESTMQASDWLSKQLLDLQMKVETAQEKLVQYQKDHGILGVDEKQNIVTDKLDQLNKDLTAAETDRIQKESLYRLIQSGSPELISSINPISASGQQSLLDKLRAQQADLKIQYARANAQFGPAYPEVVKLDNQLKQVEAEIQIEIKKIGGGVKSQYLAAVARQKMLRDALEAQKQEQNKLNESAIEYNTLKRDVDTSRQLYEGLLQKLKEAGITAGLRTNNIRVVDAARVPPFPTEPNIPRNLGFGFLLGLSSGIGLAFLLEGIDSTVRTTEQAQIISALPSLGIIPLSIKPGHPENRKQLPPGVPSTAKSPVELITQARPQSQVAESYRALRTSLLLSSLGAPPKVILVTSALPQEGKTTTSINSAIVLAQKGARVLLIDADLRRPGVAKSLGMSTRTGLSNVLDGSATLDEAITRSSLLSTLFVLPSGHLPPNPAELMASNEMKKMLAELKEKFDHIVIDTPPALSVTDAVVLSPTVDSVILVIRSGQTTKQALRRARDLLLQVNARVTGVLLNAVDLRSPEYYYYYEYRGKYGGRYYRETPAGLSKESAATPESA